MSRRLFSLMLVALLLSGCWSRIEVNDLAIVSMLGIDKTEEGDMEVWANLVIPARAGAGRGDGGSAAAPGRSFITLRGTGRTIMEAARHLQLELPRRIFWAHTRVILIGENLAREGLRPALDFLTRHRELRLTNYLVVARDPLADLMPNRTDLERLPVEYIREISRSRIGTAVTVGDWVRDLTAEGAEPTTGAVELSPPPSTAHEGQSAGLKLSGTALFKADKLVAYADESETRGLLWLRGEMHVGMVTVTVPKVPGEISVEWVRSDVERKARLEGGKVTVSVRASIEGDISEEQAKLDLSDPNVITLIETEMNKAVKNRMAAALAKMRDLNTDSAGFGEVIHRQLPAVWKRLKPTWEAEGFQQIKVELSADAKIRRTGLSSKPKGVPEDELIKPGQR